MASWSPLNVTVFLSVDGYVVDPLDPNEACSQVPVKRQNPDFVHKHPKHVVRRRKRGAPDDCVVSVNTDFCNDTKKHRVTEVWLHCIIIINNNNNNKSLFLI